MKRRDFAKNVTLATGAIGAGVLASCAQENKERRPAETAEEKDFLDKAFSEQMYAAALAITKRKVRGGDTEPFFKQPFIDAAFSPNIFLWDSCFMCCFAKYHLDELPVYQALDNFYGRMEEDGYI